MGIFNWRSHGSLYIPEEGYVHVKTYKYKYTSDDKAITNTLLGWFWDLLLEYVYPPNIAYVALILVQYDANS
jgi:hypothetical protein